MTDNIDTALKLAIEYAKMRQAIEDCILFLESDQYADRGYILSLLKKVIEK